MSVCMFVLYLLCVALCDVSALERCSINEVIYLVVVVSLRRLNPPAHPGLFMYFTKKTHLKHFLGLWDALSGFQVRNTEC